MLLLALLVIMLVMLVGLFKFIWWSMKESAQAQRYRKIMVAVEEHKTHAIAGVAPNSWLVTYRMNQAIRTQVVTGVTEADALLEHLKKGGSPRGVMSIERQN